MSNVVQMQPETASFEDFWRSYPKKSGKLLAKAKWDAITGDGLKTRIFDRDSNTYVDVELQAAPAEIIEGMRKYRDTQIDKNNGYKLKDDGKYTLNPATFLNQGRWMDLL